MFWGYLVSTQERIQQELPVVLGRGEVEQLQMKIDSDHLHLQYS